MLVIIEIFLSFFKVCPLNPVSDSLIPPLSRRIEIPLHSRLDRGGKIHFR